MINGELVPLAVLQVVPPSKEYWYEVMGSPPGLPAVKETERYESPEEMPVSVGAAGRAMGVTACNGFDTMLDPWALVATTPM